MPLHDVTDGIDPSFLDEVLVIRRADDVDQAGRTRRTPSPPIAIQAVIENLTGPMTRDPDYQISASTIRITTEFRLRGPTPGSQPDIIVIDTAPLDYDVPLVERYVVNPSDFDHYVISELNDFSRYGAGFMTGTATFTDTVPQPATGEP